MENKELVLKENNSMVVSDNTIIEYLKSFGLMNNMNDNEIKQCIEISKAFQLNPFKREIHFVAYEGKNGRQLSIIVGYETYLKRAERSGKLAGWKVWTEGQLKDRSLKAICEIYRKDWTTPFRHEVYLIEYYRETAIWREKPITMLKKIAIAQAFRLAFPDELGGLPYTAEEQWENTDIAVEIVEQKQGQNQEQKTENNKQSEENKQKQKQDEKQIIIDAQKKAEEKLKKQQEIEEKKKNASKICNVDLVIDTITEKKQKKTGQEYLVIKIKNPQLTLYCFDLDIIEKINQSKSNLDIYYVIEERNNKEWNIIIDVVETKEEKQVE